jgi:hypothetical protein
MSHAFAASQTPISRGAAPAGTTNTVGSPLFSHVLFPTYVATLLWVGLWLRDPRVRALLARRAR